MSRFKIIIVARAIRIGLRCGEKVTHYKTCLKYRIQWVLLVYTLCVLPRTGTCLGQNPAASRADDAVQTFRTAELREMVNDMPPGPERAYFTGVLAARDGQDAEAIDLLTEALPSLRTARPDRAATALRLLADTYDRTFAYRQSAAVYGELLQDYPSQLRPDDLQGAKDDSSLAHLLERSPAQTIEWSGPVHLPTNRHNPLGLITTELTVNGVPSPWVLDTGANQSVVSRSFAARLHLTMLPGHAQTSGGVTGLENPLQVAVLPTLALGGATLHNVVLLVLDDANLTISNGKGKNYIIPAIAGFPVLRALGRLTFHHDGLLEASANGGDTNQGSSMELKLLNPVVEVGVEGRTLPFTLDTGASGTTLSVRFYRLFKAEEATWKHSTTKSFGAGGATSSKTYLLRSLPVVIGGTTVTLKNRPILPTPQGADIDALFGNMGEDLLQSAESFTLDFTHMRFVLGEPLAIRTPAKTGTRTTTVP
jgi:predicted aspartyl protease